MTDHSRASSSATDVLIFATNDLRTETRAKKEATALARAGYRVQLVGLGGESLPLIEQLEDVAVRRIASVKETTWRRPLEKIAAARRRKSALDELVSELRPRAIHAVNADGLVAAASVATKYRAALVYDAFEIFDEMLKGVGRPMVSWRYWRWAERRAMRHVDLALTVSEALAIELERRLGRPFEVIHNVPPLVPLGEPGRLRAELGLGDSTTIVLYQGGLTPGRALGRLVDAMSQVESSVLVVQGDGPERVTMESVAASKGLSDRVFFMGFKPEESLHSYARDADVGVVIYEPTDLNNMSASPNKLFSYMMAALPMACSNFPGLESVVLGNDIGVSFDPLSSDSIAAAINRLLVDPERTEKGARARQLAEERYNWDRESVKLVSLYDKMLGSPAAE